MEIIYVDIVSLDSVDVKVLRYPVALDLSIGICGWDINPHSLFKT